MNSFYIKETQFGIAETSLEIKNGFMSLEVSGDEDIFDNLTKDDESEWSWALYAPKIYFRDIPYTAEQFVVNEENLDEYDIGLYMMEHGDFLGKIETFEAEIHITGNAEIAGEWYPVSIVVDISK